MRGLAGCSLFDCEDTVVLTLESPLKTNAASIVRRDCGVTTPGTTAVLLHVAGLEPDFDTDIQLLAVRGIVEVELEWLDFRTLRVAGDFPDSMRARFEVEGKAIRVEPMKLPAPGG